MESLENNNITTSQIVERDNWRVKNYRESLRGYQVREDILEGMFQAVDLKDLSHKEEIVVADIGCGPGICGEYFTNKLRERVKDEEMKIKTVFVDMSQQMLEQIPEKDGYYKVKGDITNIPLETGLADIITIKQVLDYLPEQLQIKALSEINRVLKDDGKFILSALVSPDKKIDKLTNYFYSEREKIIAEKMAIEKFIPNESVLLDWLKNSGFSKNKILYNYDIPLSTDDFKKSFNLSDDLWEKLKLLYKEIIFLDKNNFFQAKETENDFELVERGIVVKSVK